ncbi:hypothetical protein [uncultured Roseovarius sp.]|uniref:hypothetical protein n=1 Tax=uncultured Roseovarius sp. TaxID=293344 RepID=UPI002625DDA1|nr:hypothetical protein [uncultured Roseovarius sp.]
MPLTMDEFGYLRETIEQVKGLAALAKLQAQAEETSPQPGQYLPVLLSALGRACDDAIAVAEGMVEVPDLS